KWSRHDKELLSGHFGSWIVSKEDNNKWCTKLVVLQLEKYGKELFMKYIVQFEPASISHLEVKEQYLNTRAKLFNERKNACLSLRNDTSHVHHSILKS
ncbi:hypothetical protein MAR_036249, partial [Mya arenaria]